MAIRTAVIDTNHWRFSSPSVIPAAFHAIHAAGFDFGIAKATEHISFVDDTYVPSVDAMEQEEMVDGSFHYYRTTFDPVAQAKHYYSIARNTHMFPVVDLERKNNVNAFGSPLVALSKVTADLWIFLNESDQLFGSQTWLYSSLYSIKTLTTVPAWFANRKLWVASYTTALVPTLPPPWSNTGTWHLWQYTSAYPIAGKNYDANWFNGSKEQLLALCRGKLPLTLEQKVDKLWQAHPELQATE